MMHRVVIHLPDNIYQHVYAEATRRTIGVSTLIRQLIIDADAKVHGRAPQNSPAPISDRMNNLNYKPTPEPMSDDAVDQACFKSYRDDGGQINNIKAWIEAGKPAPEQNR
jgi:hypothetical protein